MLSYLRLFENSRCDDINIDSKDKFHLYVALVFESARDPALHRMICEAIWVNNYVNGSWLVDIADTWDDGLFSVDSTFNDKFFKAVTALQNLGNNICREYAIWYQRELCKCVGNNGKLKLLYQLEQFYYTVCRYYNILENELDNISEVDKIILGNFIVECCLWIKFSSVCGIEIESRENFSKFKNKPIVRGYIVEMVNRIWTGEDINYTKFCEITRMQNEKKIEGEYKKVIARIDNRYDDKYESSSIVVYEQLCKVLLGINDNTVEKSIECYNLIKILRDLGNKACEEYLKRQDKSQSEYYKNDKIFCKILLNKHQIMCKIFSELDNAQIDKEFKEKFSDVLILYFVEKGYFGVVKDVKVTLNYHECQAFFMKNFNSKDVVEKTFMRHVLHCAFVKNDVMNDINYNLIQLSGDIKDNEINIDNIIQVVPR